MSTFEDQIAAEEAHMAEQRAAFEKQQVELEVLWKEAEEEVKRKRAEEERKWKEEEKKKKKQAEEEQKKRLLEIEQQKEREVEERQKAVEAEQGQVVEEEQKRWMEAHLSDKRVAEQLAQVARTESSKQATQDFAWAALAYWRSWGMAPGNQLWMELGSVGTNNQVSGFCPLSRVLWTDVLKKPLPCLNCEWRKEQCNWVDGSWVCVACAWWKIACPQKDMRFTMTVSNGEAEGWTT